MGFFIIIFMILVGTVTVPASFVSVGCERLEVAVLIPVRLPHPKVHPGGMSGSELRSRRQGSGLVSTRRPGAALERLESTGNVLRRQRDLGQRRAAGDSCPISVRVGGSVISRKDVHSEKALCPISVRSGGSVISLKDSHSQKAPAPISVGGRVISVKDVQPWKAHRPISARVGGSVVSAKNVQLAKAIAPIAVRVRGSVISAKDEHSQQAYAPMLVRAGGSVISVKDEQPMKALCPILVTPFGTVTASFPSGPAGCGGSSPLCAGLGLHSSSRWSFKSGSSVTSSKTSCWSVAADGNPPLLWRTPRQLAFPSGLPQRGGSWGEPWR